MTGGSRGFGIARSTRKGALLAVTAGVVAAMVPAAWTAGAPRVSGTAQQASALYADSLRVDSLRSVISPDRLESLRREAAGNEDPRSWYDLGAALLATGDWEGALEPLQRVVAGAPSDGVAESASYNLGVAQAVGGRPRDSAASDGPPSEIRRAALLRARDAFRRVLRLDPGADDARWNLEVVERWLEALGGGGGGGGGGQGGGERGPEGEPREMTPEEVRRLLEAAASEERRVQQERFQDSRARDPVAERNW